MQKKSGELAEWLFPLAFVGTTAWLIWHLPAFMLDWIPYTSDSMRAQVEAIYIRADITPDMVGIFGGHIDILDMTALILTPVFAFLVRSLSSVPVWNTRAPVQLIGSPYSLGALR